MGQLGKGRDNYLILFQGLFLLASSRQYHRLQYTYSTYASHWHPNCPTCLVPCESFVCELPASPALQFPSIQELPTPVRPGPVIPSTMEDQSESYTFFSTSSAKARFPLWFDIPLVSPTESVANVRTSVTLILSLCSFSKNLQHSYIPVDEMEKLTVDHVKAVDLNIVTALQASLLLITEILEQDEIKLRYNPGSNKYSVTASVHQNLDRVKPIVTQCLKQTSFSELLRVISNVDQLVSWVVAENPGSMIGPFPISRQCLKQAYNNVILSKIWRMTPELLLQLLTTYLSRIILPADCLSPTLIIGLRALQQILIQNVPLRIVLGWKQEMNELFSEGWDPDCDPKTRGISLGVDIGIWKIPLDLKSVLKTLPHNPIIIKEMALTKELLPNAEAAVVVSSKGACGRMNAPITSSLARSPLIHFLRPVVFGANGTRKIISVLEQVVSSDISYIGVFGDGNGGFTRACLSYFDRCNVIFGSLAQYHGTIEQAGNVQVPLCLIGLPRMTLLTRVMSLNDVLTEETDMTNPEWISGTLARLKGKRLDLIICDAEVRGTIENSTIIKHLLIVATNCGCKEVIVKQHLDVESSTTMQRLRKVLASQNHWCYRLLRSRYSNMGSFEIYVQFVSRSKITQPEYREFLKVSQLTDRELIQGNNEVFITSDRHQLLRCRQEGFGASLQAAEDDWIRKGFWEKIRLFDSLAVPLSGIDPPDKLQNLILEFENLLDTLSGSAIRLSIFRTDKDAKRRGRVMSRALCVNLIGISIGAGAMLAVLLEDLEMYSKVLRWYRMDQVALRCNTRAKLAFEFGIRCKDMGMDIPFREFKPIVHSTIRYMSAATRKAIPGKISNHRTRCFSKLKEHPVISMMMKETVNFIFITKDVDEKEGDWLVDETDKTDDPHRYVDTAIE